MRSFGIYVVMLGMIMSYSQQVWADTLVANRGYRTNPLLQLASSTTASPAAPAALPSGGAPITTNSPNGPVTLYPSGQSNGMITVPHGYTLYVSRPIRTNCFYGGNGLPLPNNSPGCPATLNALDAQLNQLPLGAVFDPLQQPIPPQQQNSAQATNNAVTNRAVDLMISPDALERGQYLDCPSGTTNVGCTNTPLSSQVFVCPTAVGVTDPASGLSACMVTTCSNQDGAGYVERYHAHADCQAN